jgi:hypothetical protein
MPEIEVASPSLVRQGEMADQFEAMFRDGHQAVIHPAHGRVVAVEACLDLGWRVLLAPDRVGKGEVANIELSFVCQGVSNFGLNHRFVHRESLMSTA